MVKHVLQIICLLSFTSSVVLGQGSNAMRAPSTAAGGSQSAYATGQGRSVAKSAMTNEDVTQMVAVGLTDMVIANSIKQAKVRQFDLSPTGLIKLKADHVPDSIIAIMQDPLAPLPGSTPQVVQGSEQTSPSKTEEPPQQPYAIVLSANGKNALKKAAVKIVATKAKGEDLTSVAKSEAISGALQGAGAVALTSSAVSSMGMASVPFIGAAGNVMDGLLGRRRQKTNYVWALPGQHAMTVLPIRGTSFEVTYGDIPGVDPENFEPALIKVEATKDNWRLVGASEGVMSANMDTGGAVDLYSHFIEDRATFVKLTKLGRGQVRVEMDNQIPPGEYALVLRPISKDMKFSQEDIGKNEGEGLLFNSAWDFSLVSPSK